LAGLDVAVYVLIGLFGSFCSGLLGVGGAIVTYPLLYFVPPLLGAYAMSPGEISSATMWQVFASSFCGMLMYGKSPWFDRTVLLVIGGGMLGGSLVGSLLSGWMPDAAIHLLYGCMALLAVVLLFRRQRGELPDSQSEEQPRPLQLNRRLAVGLASVVGLFSGIVGAGGSFLLIPLMINVLRVPIRTAIASSLGVVFVSSIGGVIGKATTGQSRYDLTLLLVLSSLLGSVLGARVGQRLNTQLLRLILALVILIAALNIWGELLWKMMK
jgi:uncharacterized protein